MTSVNVEPARTERILPMHVPSYAYQYPSMQRVQLAAAKEGLYHPNLPTFRRMDMDTAGHKLPDEHCRTTTRCGPADFQRATSTLFTNPTKPLHSAQITDTGRQLHRYYTTPDELKQTRVGWSDFLDRSPERFNIRLPELPSNKDLHFSGYAVRYLRPQVTGSWNYTLRQEPSLDQYSQKPIPANVYGRHRDTNSRNHRRIASQAWQP